MTRYYKVTSDGDLILFDSKTERGTTFFVENKRFSALVGLYAEGEMKTKYKYGKFKGKPFATRIPRETARKIMGKAFGLPITPKCCSR